jgi:FkbM family methyltransferase
MLISGNRVIELLNKYGITVKGALHIGAHECEELSFYISMGIKRNQIVWIDAMQNKVDEAVKRNIPNVFQAVITDKDDTDITFHVSNNVQSSSILEMGSHSAHHPHIHFVRDIALKTVTIDTFFERQGLDATAYDFWNFDIQGAELLALQGAKNALATPKAIYLEVNSEEVYKGGAIMDQLDAFLAPHGFKRIETYMTPYGWGDALYLKI